MNPSLVFFCACRDDNEGKQTSLLTILISSFTGIVHWCVDIVFWFVSKGIILGPKINSLEAEPTTEVSYTFLAFGCRFDQNDEVKEVSTDSPSDVNQADVDVTEANGHVE